MESNLILFALSAIGMAHIIVDGSIMEWFRTAFKEFTKKINLPHLGSVVDCYLCCGTWCGFLMGYIWISHEFLKVFGCGCAGGFLAAFAAIVLNWVESATIVNLPDHSHES